MKDKKPELHLLSRADCDRRALDRYRTDAELVHVRRGIWAPTAGWRGDPDAIIAAVASQLPDHAVLAGWAAARLHERAAVQRDSLEFFNGAGHWASIRALGARDIPDGRMAPVLISSARESRLVLRDDVFVFRSNVPPAERTVLEGMPVTTGLRTAFDIARLHDHITAIQSLDRLAFLGVVELEDVLAITKSRPRWMGHGRAVAAARRARPGVASPMESSLRLLWIECGFREPLLNADVYDDKGEFVARVDLLDPVVGIVGEYDGEAFHSSPDAKERDRLRQARLEALGLVVVRSDKGDFTSMQARRALGWRIREAYEVTAKRPKVQRWAVRP